MNRSKYTLALGAFFVAVALAVSGCGSGVPGDAVVNMAGNPVTLKAFNHWMYVAAKGQASQSPGQPVIVPNDPPNFAKCVAQAKAQIPALKKVKDAQVRTDCKTLFTSLSAQVMDFLIKGYWYQADAHKLGIKITTAQVNTALAAAKKGQFSTAAQFQAFLTSTGQTMSDILFRVRVQQIYQKLLAKHPTTVSTAQIAAYYASHKAQFGTPETRNMKIVLTKTAADANAALKALRKGTSWKVVAKKYSIDPTTKNTGGVLNNVAQGQQDAALTTAAFGAPLNKLIGPVKGQFGYYLVDVTKITPATSKSLAQSSALIKQTLTSQAQTAATNAVEAQAKKDWLKKTTCRSLYSMADCNGYKAPKATAVSGAAGATGASGATAPAGASGATTAAP